MNKRYNYKYRSSKRKNNNKLITLIVVLAIILIGIVLIITNKDKIIDVIADIFGMETTTSEQINATTESKKTTQKTSLTSTSSKETTTTTSEDLEWYQKDLEYTREAINVEPLVNELRNFIFSFSGQYGVGFIDLTSGAEFGINDIDYYDAASTIKIPLSLFIYDQVANDGLNLNKKMTYLEEDKEGGTGYIINHGKIGEEFSLRTLCKYAITYSDNIATNMLLREFGRTGLKAFMRTLGGEIVDDTDNVSCPRDMAIYLRKLYLFEQEYPDIGREIISYLEKTHLTVGGYVNTPGADQRLVKYLPPDLMVAHKIGNVTGGWHDVGIVFTERPYVITVMTYGALYDEVNDVIANISKKVYEYLENLKTY